MGNRKDLKFTLVWLSLLLQCVNCYIPTFIRRNEKCWWRTQFGSWNITRFNFVQWKCVNLSTNQGHIVFTFHVQVHCSYRLEFFVVKNHLKDSSLYNHSLFGSPFTQSCHTHSSQRSRNVVWHMHRCIAIKSQKCIQIKIPGLVQSSPNFKGCSPDLIMYPVTLRCGLVETLMWWSKLWR